MTTLEAFISEQGSVQPALPKAFPGLKTLNSPPKKLSRLGNHSFTLQGYIKISDCWKNTRQGLTTPASNMNHHLFNKIGFLRGSRLDNGLQSNCLYTSDSNPTLNRSDRKLLPNYAGSMDYSNCSNTLSLSPLGITSIQKSLPQVELIQRILLKHWIFQKLKKLCSFPTKRQSA